MNIFNFFNKRHQQKKEEHKEQVEKEIHARKNKFTSDMLKLQAQAKRVHETSVKSLEEAKKMDIIVTDIASSIAVATGGTRRTKK